MSNLHEGIRKQYLAALQMLETTIHQCPKEWWNNPKDKLPFWRIAYHGLFYTHLYLQTSEDTFQPWEKHLPKYNFLGATPDPTEQSPKKVNVYSPQEILEYLALCREQINEKIPATDFSAPSGFSWIPFNKFELLLYNLRHLQHHTAELMNKLDVNAGIEIDWIGSASE